MHTKFLLIPLSFISIFYSSFTFSALLPIEKRITAYITAHQNEQLSLLEKLVNINSGTANIPGVYQVGEILKPQFEALGFKTRWVKPYSNMSRAGTLLAEHQGKKGKSILLIGHLDTVFSKTQPFQTFERDGQFVKGPGVMDAKGGDVIILYALKALNAIHALHDANIIVVLTGDEEDSLKPVSISRKVLFDLAHQSEVALDFEFAITSDTATVARRGVSHWQIETKGNNAHSAGIFQSPSGYGAIFELARILNTMQLQLAKEKYLSFNPGLILGGTHIQYDKHNREASASGKDNVIAKNAMARGDLRFLTQEQRKRAEKQMQEIVKHHLPGTQAFIQFQEGIAAMSPTSSNLKLLKKYSIASQELGYGPIKEFDPGARGAGDISYIAAIVPANLSGLGALGKGAHSNKESINIYSLTMQTERAALLIYRLTY